VQKDFASAAHFGAAIAPAKAAILCMISKTG
jgi:hypothetical protein